LDDRRRTIDEKFEVQAFLAGEAAAGEAAVVEAAVGVAAVVVAVVGVAAVVVAVVAEAAAVETMLERVEVSGLGAGLAARVVRVEPVK